MAGASDPLIRRKAVELGLLPMGGAGRARVLMYHGVGDDGCSAISVRHLPRELFRHHLQLYREHFHITSLEALCAGERHPHKLSVALTFDDGLRNNLTHALPLLEQHAVPATFFITGANPAGLPCLWGDLADLAPRVTDRPVTIAGERFVVNERSRYASTADGILLNDRVKQLGVLAPKRELYEQLGDLLLGPLTAFQPYWRLMTDDELRQVANHPLISLGSHGWWHNDMGRIPLDEVNEELSRSRNYLEGLGGTAITSIAWPAGSYSSRTVDAARDLGFRNQFAVDFLDAADRASGKIHDRHGVFDFPVRDRYFLHLIARGAR